MGFLNLFAISSMPVIKILLVVIQITRPPSNLRGLVIGSCAAANLGSLPLIILFAVCKERGSPFGDPDVCSEHGMGYASLSMALAVPQTRFEENPQIAGFVVGLVPQIRKILLLLFGLKEFRIEKSVVLGIIIIRYVALPLLGIGVVKGAIHFGLVHHNPLYEFVLLLQFALPPAMNIGTVSQLFGAGETECSVIRLWCYALASITLTLWSTLFLWIVA
ncbi:PIN-LIKES 3-like isoform X1 [Olea europaea subsp. europaea]|uniref:PIN-LIKES 3-like isoform X1 n=1 Tax=Olea europaea subsp. europaea TaxID=158383 RepID=A0A8S0QUL7_OLEEU|nr:PIN-LIKES 3-like isoform X1 [Olea europaea subsp. europaea]